MAKKAKLTDKRHVLPLMLITLLFFLWGFARAILDVLNKHLQDALDISISQSAWIQATTYLGYFLMAIPAGIFINRYGYRSGVVLGLLLFGTGALAFIPIASYVAFLLALFVIGCGLTLLETAANPYVTELGPSETASSRLNLSQTFNGMGCFMATLLVGQFLFGGEAEKGSIAVPYGLMGGLVLLLALLFSKARLPEVNDGGLPHSLRTDIVALLRRKSFVLGWLALLAYEVAEISINSYFVNFVTAGGLMDSLGASRLVTLALVIFMVGRFAGSWIMTIVRPQLVLLCCSVLTVVCVALTMLLPGWWSLAALVANFLFEAIMFPTIFSLTVGGLGRLTKTSGSLLMMTPIGGCGFLLMGAVADGSGNIYLPFTIPLVAFCAVLAYSTGRLRHSLR